MHRQILHAFLAASVLLLAACGDTQDVHYPTAREAHADGAIQRGWLPTALPNSASDISESHDLDTNTGGGSFRFAASDADSFRAQLQPMSAAQVQSLDADRAKLQRDGYTYHSAPGFWFAINWQTRQVQFWLNPKSE